MVKRFKGSYVSNVEKSVVKHKNMITEKKDTYDATHFSISTTAEKIPEQASTLKVPPAFVISFPYIILKIK